MSKIDQNSESLYQKGGTGSLNMEEEEAHGSPSVGLSKPKRLLKSPLLNHRPKRHFHSTSSITEDLKPLNNDKVLSHNITIVKHCRPLFGLVKHHVCAKFQMLAFDDLKEDSESDVKDPDLFSSLPPTMNSLCVPNFSGTFDYDHQQPSSMPSSPFRSFAGYLS